MNTIMPNWNIIFEKILDRIASKDKCKFERRIIFKTALFELTCNNEHLLRDDYEKGKTSCLIYLSSTPNDGILKFFTNVFDAIKAEYKNAIKDEKVIYDNIVNRMRIFLSFLLIYQDNDSLPHADARDLLQEFCLFGDNCYASICIEDNNIFKI